MANKAEECRLRAEQCEQTAKAATNPTDQPHLRRVGASVASNGGAGGGV